MNRERFVSASMPCWILGRSYIIERNRRELLNVLLKASPVLISLPTVSPSMHREPEQAPDHNKAISITHQVLHAVGETPGIKAFDNKFKVFNVFQNLSVFLLRFLMEECFSLQLPALFCYATVLYWSEWQGSLLNPCSSDHLTSRFANTTRFIFNDLLKCIYSGLPLLKDPPYACARTCTHTHAHAPRFILTNLTASWKRCL